MAERLKILVVRADRMGDVILSTPVFDVIKRHYSGSSLTVMVRPPQAALIQGLPAVDEVLVYDPEGRHKGLRGFWRLVREMRRAQFKIAVVLQSQARIALAVFLGRVRFRIGPLSKIHSYLLYNRGVRQRRSQVEMHETDYNLQLLRRLGIRVGTRKVPLKVSCPEETLASAKSWLQEQSKQQAATELAPLIAVHPGMGGSALNWPESHYIELIAALLKDGRRVLVTGGALEGPLLSRIRETLNAGSLGPGSVAKAIFYFAEGRPPEFLAGLFAQAQLVIAPSTGPVHLAVALGIPVVTFYPPVRVQSAIRWGPYVEDEERASVLVPDVYCGQDFKCAGNLCNYYPCMKSITVNQALSQANHQLKNFEARS
jgi:ADP-heptose:LPS heptosyltransferase